MTEGPQRERSNGVFAHRVSKSARPWLPPIVAATLALGSLLSLQGLQAAEWTIPVHEVDGSFVRNWLVLGPFPSKTIEPDFLANLGGEANIRPTEGDQVRTPEGASLTWTRLDSPLDQLHIESVLGHQDWSVAYLYCELETGQAFDSLVRMQRDLSACWINGVKLEDDLSSVKRWGNVPRFRVAKLRPGKNRCLLKVQANLNEWTTGFQPLPARSAGLDLHVSSAAGEHASDASVEFYEGGRQTWSVRTDTQGYAAVSLFPLAASYDVRITWKQEAQWLENVTIAPGERRRVEVPLEPAVSISGFVLSMDRTPQAAVVVQAIHLGHSEAAANSTSNGGAGGLLGTEAIDSKIPLVDRLSKMLIENPMQLGISAVPSRLPLPAFSDTEISQTDGSFNFIGLKPGRYQLRVHTGSGYVDPQTAELRPSKTPIVVSHNGTEDGIEFHIPHAQKGAYRTIVATRGVTKMFHQSVNRSADGMLWIGTRDGTVTGYDGSNFVRTIKAPARDVRMITTDSAGRNWVATNSGIGWFRDYRSEELEVRDEFVGKNVWGIAASDQGAPLFGTRNGLLSYENNSFVSVGIPEGLPCNSVYSLLEDVNGVVWMGTPAGLVRKDGENISLALSFGGFHSRGITHLHQASDGAIWFSITARERVGGAFRFDGETIQRLGAEDGLPSSAVYDIEETSDGILWFGTHAGLSRFDGQTIVNYVLKDEEGMTGVSDIFVDSDNTLWLATGRSVTRFSPSEIINFDKRDGLRNNGNQTAAVLKLEPDTKGGFWAGCEWGGLVRMSGGREPQLTASYLPEQYIRFLKLSEDGDLWITTTSGIQRFRDGVVTQILQRNWILALAVDAHGGLWFGNGWYQGGVSHYDPRSDRETVFNRSNGLPHDEVWSLATAPDGKVLVGTSAGLRAIDPATLAIERMSDDLPDTSFLDIRLDTDGAWWLAGSGGVHRLKDSEVTSYTPANGFPEGASWCSAETSDGVLWIGTANYGLLGYDGHAITMLDARDGLCGNKVFTIAKEENDALWLGFQDGGLTRYQRGSSRPTAQLVRAKIGNQSVTDISNLPSVKTGDRLTIEYGAIDLKTLPEKQQFHYRLSNDIGTTIASGVTKDRRFEWVPSQGGSYEFELQAIDRDLNYSDPVKLSFEASVPWHSNPWVVVPSVAALFALVLWAGLSTRLYLIRRREATRAEERARIARDLHDQMGAGLTHVAMLSDLLRERSDRSASTYSLTETLTESTRELTRTVGQVVWSADPTQDTLQCFVSYVHSYAERYFAEHPIEMRADLPIELPEQALNATFRHEVFMVIKEALNNAVKHSEAEEVRMTIKVIGDRLEIVIENDGPGFDPESIGNEGRGIANMRERIARLKGVFELESSPEKGTKISMRVPLQ